MMCEVCFCGWSGRLEDREPLYVGDGEYALECPRCGHLDRLEWLPAAARGRILAEAARRLSERRPAETVGQVPSSGW